MEDGNVSVIDTTTNTVIDTVEVGREPKGIVVNETKAYVPFGQNSVAIIDTLTDKVLPQCYCRKQSL